jgi:MtN3 and saliva related transmembrane protein
MQWFDYVGYFGSFLTSITFVPQVIKAWQTRSVGDLSRWTVIIVIVSASVWLTYGLASENGPVIVANAVVLLSALVLLFFTFYFNGKQVNNNVGDA